MNSIDSNYADWESNQSSLQLELVNKRKEFEAPSDSARMKNGKQLVVGGFAASVLGIVMYCTVAFSAEFAQTEPAFIAESLSVVGAGVLCWLIGAIKYVNAAIDCDSSDEMF
jgi:hypothetical protein